MPTSTPRVNNSSPQLSPATGRDINDATFGHAPGLKGATGKIFNGTDRNAEAPKELKQYSSPNAPYSSDAVSRQNLHTAGTRTVTLGRLQSLATSSDLQSPDIVWMHGPAGTGKSTIMRAFANTLDEEGLLLASFFFFRSDSERNTSRFFIPTLASQAWDALPATQTHVSQAIQQRQHLFFDSAHRQSPHLLEAPLLAALTPTGTALTIIVDGLDECTNAGGQTEIIKILAHLASSIRASSNRRVKIFIASRPEHEIKSTFAQLASDEHIAIFPLDNSDANIHLFYDEQFDKIREKFELPPSWPSKEEIKWLMDTSSRLYSFAGISTRFMYGGDPVGRLKILQDALKGDNLQPSEALDQLYAAVFEQLPQDMRTPAVLVLRCALHPQWNTTHNVLLGPLLQLPRDCVQRLAPYLSSLINFDDELKPYHASLADFLVDPSRCRRFSLHVDDQTLSHAIQKGVLATLTERDPPKQLSSKEEIHFLNLFEERDCHEFIQELVVSHPLPSTELALALKKADPSSLTISVSILFYWFLEFLQQQHQHRHLYVTRPVPWHTIQFALPRQIRLGWERRTALYSSISQEKVDLVFGVALASRGYVDAWFNEQFFQHLDEALITIDSSRGWNIRAGEASRLRTWALRLHLQTSFNGGRFWSSLRSVLLLVSSCPRVEYARAGILSLIHSEHTDCLSQCAACAVMLSKIDAKLLAGVALLIDNDKTPLRPKELVGIYRLTRDNEICWDSAYLVPCLANYTRRCLDMARFRYLPSFIIQSQRRELEEISQDLERRSDELRVYNSDGSYMDRRSYTPKEKEPLLWFIVLQLRIYQDLVFFGICSLIVCLCVVYVML